MTQRGKPWLSSEQKRELWRRWKAGEPLTEIARALGRRPRSIHAVVAANGGCMPAARHRSPRSLSLAEREEICRGLAEGVSLRPIAHRSRRAASTISREIARNGGRRRYRAAARTSAPGTGPAVRSPASSPSRCGCANSSPRSSPESGRPSRSRAGLPGRTRASRLSGCRPRRSTAASSSRRAVCCAASSRPTCGPGAPCAARATRPGRARAAADRRRGFDPRTAGGGRGPGGTRPLGRRPPGGLREHPHRHPRRAPDALPAPGQGHPQGHDDRRRRHHRAGTDAAREAPRQPHLGPGHELADHRRFTVATDVVVYFCDPRSPWQRGSNENTNGLLRQYFPKKTDLSIYSQADLDAVAARLNERPRKTLAYRTPAAMLAEAVASTD